MSDAVEAFGEHVQQEPSHELEWGEPHRLPTCKPIGATILVTEGDAAIVGGHQPPVGDGDAVCVPRQIEQDLLRTGERFLAIDHPLDVAQRRDEAL